MFISTPSHFCVYLGWGALHWATSLGHFTACIGSMGTLFACNLGLLYSLLYCIIKITPYSFIHI